MKSGSFSRYMTRMLLLGLGIGLVLFVLSRAAVFELPVVIGTTSYEGMASSLLLLAASPVLLGVVGLILYLFRRK